MLIRTLFGALVLIVACTEMNSVLAQAPVTMDWQRLPNLPDSLGVAGPFVGVHNDALIVAGGANFPLPVWETQKVWYSDIHVLQRTPEGYRWTSGGQLRQAIGYGATVSLPEGILCLGGNDAQSTFRETFLLSWDAQTRQVTQVVMPAMPASCANGQAVVIDSVVYLAGGQSGSGLETALNNFWALDVSNLDRPENLKWIELPACPGGARSLNLTLGGRVGSDHCIYIFSGRRQGDSGPEFLRDLWRFNLRTRQWQACEAAPHCRMAGTGLRLPNGDLLVLGGDDGSLFLKTDELKDQHPGFRRDALLFRAATNSWEAAGSIPANHVTTSPCQWGEYFIVASGEVRPRVRSPHIWQIDVSASAAK